MAFCDERLQQANYSHIGLTASFPTN